MLLALAIFFLGIPIFILMIKILQAIFPSLKEDE